VGAPIFDVIPLKNLKKDNPLLRVS